MNGRINFVLFVLAGGFFMTAFEVRYLHRDILAENAVAWTPIAFSLLAMIACFLGMGKNKMLKLIAAFIFAVSLPVAGIGFWNHTRWNNNVLTKMMDEATKMPSEHEDDRGRRDSRPALAPLSLAGLGLIGLTLVWPSRRRS